MKVQVLNIVIAIAIVERCVETCELRLQRMINRPLFVSQTAWSYQTNSWAFVAIVHKHVQFAQVLELALPCRLHRIPDHSTGAKPLSTPT